MQPLRGKLQGPEPQQPVLGGPAPTGVPTSMQETPSDPTSVPAPSTSNVPATQTPRSNLWSILCSMRVCVHLLRCCLCTSIITQNRSTPCQPCHKQYRQNCAANAMNNGCVSVHLTQGSYLMSAECDLFMCGVTLPKLFSFSPCNCCACVAAGAGAVIDAGSAS